MTASHFPPSSNGWLIVDKPYGMTSAQAVARVKRLTKAKKVGHGGTLDPLATGLLPIALGQATKAMPYIVDTRKAYRFTVAWGSATSTDDAEGEVVRASDLRPTRNDIETILPSFIGTVSQVPPQFSAIKVQGKRAYAVARSGGVANIAARPVEVYAIDLEAFSPEYTVFSVVCGKGTYVRSLARDMGERLGCYGHVAQLRRIQVGKFTEKHTISLDKLAEVVHNGALLKALYPVDAVLDDIPALQITAAQAIQLRNGCELSLPTDSVLELKDISQVRALSGDEFIAIANLQDQVLKPVKVFGR